jgi:hypothetical protein
MPRQCNSAFHHANNIWWAVQINKSSLPSPIFTALATCPAGRLTKLGTVQSNPLSLTKVSEKKTHFFRAVFWTTYRFVSHSILNNRPISFTQYFEQQTRFFHTVFRTTDPFLSHSIFNTTPFSFAQYFEQHTHFFHTVFWKTRPFLSYSIFNNTPISFAQYPGTRQAQCVSLNLSEVETGLCNTDSILLQD